MSRKAPSPQVFGGPSSVVLGGGGGGGGGSGQHEPLIRCRKEHLYIAIDGSSGGGGGWASDADALSSLARDLLINIEVFLPVQSLLVLATVSSALHAHLASQEIWRTLFVLRWGSQYNVDPATKVSPTLYSMISSTSLWSTIERAFLLSPSISRNYKSEQKHQVRPDNGQSSGMDLPF